MKALVFLTLAFGPLGIETLAAVDIVVPSKCVNWYNSSGTVTSRTTECENNCRQIPMDLESKNCIEYCAVLCAGYDKYPPYGRIVDTFIIYPGLTGDEKALIRKHPIASFTVFLQKERAEFATDRNFPEGGVDDEADAFRHFIWAVLPRRIECGLIFDR